MKSSKSMRMVAAIASLLTIVVSVTVLLVRAHLQKQREEAQQKAMAAYQDNRLPRQVAEDYLRSRGRMHGTLVSEEAIDTVGKGATCLLDKMGIADGAQGPAKVSIMVRGEGMNFEFAPNLHGYVNVEVRKNAIRSIRAMQAHEYARKGLEWLSMPPEELLRQPLDCLKDSEGRCVTQADGSYCLLLAPVAKQLSKVSATMKADGKGELRPTRCFSSNLEGAVLFTALSGRPCEIDVETLQVLHLPGSSPHSLGLQLDIPKPQVAEPYLALMAGAMCPFGNREKTCCGLGMSFPTSVAILKLRMFEIKRNEQQLSDFLERAGVAQDK